MSLLAGVRQSWAIAAASGPSFSPASTIRLEPCMPTMLVRPPLVRRRSRSGPSAFAPAAESESRKALPSEAHRSKSHTKEVPKMATLSSWTRRKTTVYAPVQKSKKDGLDPHTPREYDSPEVAEWRTRMATDEAKATYKERAATAECVNAIARNRGLQQFRVRGSPKVSPSAFGRGVLPARSIVFLVKVSLKSSFGVISRAEVVEFPADLLRPPPGHVGEQREVFVRLCRLVGLDRIRTSCIFRHVGQTLKCVPKRVRVS